MKILVCIKQVADTESRFKVNSDGNWFIESDLAFRTNEYDDYAVEQAVLVKEALGNQPEVVVLSIGPGRVSESLRKALAMGCDRAIHIHDDESWKKDPYQIASMIHSQVSNENFDLIFTGMQSQDRGSAQVGVLLAGMLEIACSTTAIGFELKDHTVTIRRELEGGMKSIVNMKLPALVTCQLGLNRPRYPTLPNIMKAKKKELKTVSVDEMNVPATMSLTKQIYTPARKGSGQVLDGDVKVSATRLVEILKEKTTVLR